MFLPLYQTLPSVSGSLGEVKDPLLGALSTALENRPVFGCRILIRNVLPLPDFCISHTIDFFPLTRGKKVGCISHWSLRMHPRSSLLGHLKASSTLLSFCLGLPCEFPVGDHGEECELPGCGPLVFTFVKPPDLAVCGGYFFPHALPQMSRLLYSSLSLWALALKFNFLGCFITGTISWS